MSSVEVTAEALGLELLGVTAPEQRQAINALLRGLPTEGWKHVTDALGVSDQQLTEVAWFATPNHQLTGETPLIYLRTSIGAAEVHHVLERILDGAPA